MIKSRREFSIEPQRSDALKKLFRDGETSRMVHSSMSEAATESIAAVPRRSRRRRRGKKGWTKCWIVLGSIVVAGAGLFFGARIWITNYLQSDKFRVWISGAIASRLDADVQLDGIRWQDSSASVGTFTATGSADSSFAKIEARDLRATINAGAIWDRVWQVDEIKIARVFLDFSNTQPREASSPQGTGTSVGSGESSGFFASLLPNRTVVKGAEVDQFGFLWANGTRSAKASGINLHVKPAEGNEFFLASGQRGTLELSMLPDAPVTLREIEASLQGDEFIIEDLTAEAAGADITAEGTILTGDKPSLDLKGTVAGLDLSRCIPEDWLKSLKGKADGDVRITGDPGEFAKLKWRGTVQLRDGLLEGLPLLHVIARKTRNESFIRLLLKDAHTEFTRTTDGGWLLEKLNVDAPGLLRLKGAVSAAPDDTLHGELLLGIVPGTLRYLAGAEQQVFQPLERLLVTRGERALLSSADSGLLWTRLRLRGTLGNPQEDLADRLAKAWFNATVDEVMNMSMEGAVKAAETASKAAAEAAGTVLENAPEILEKGLQTGSDILGTGIESGAGLLEKGVEGGIKTIEGLIPGR